MRFLILLLLLIVGFAGYSQNANTCEKFVEILETEIVFNEYLTDEVRVEKISHLIENVSKENFDKKEIFLKYAKLNLANVKNKEANDQSLYKFVELTEICDTTNQIEIRIYLGSLLLISNMLRDNHVFEISNRFIGEGIDFIERRKLKNYPWIQKFYNNSGGDLLVMGEFKKCRVASKKALFYGGRKDFLQDALIEYNLGFLYYQLSNLDSAIIHQKHACSLLEKINNLSSYAYLYSRYGNALGSLSLFYYKNNNFVLAQSTALKAKSVYEEVDLFNVGRYPHLKTLINIAIKDNNEDQIKILQDEITSVASKTKTGIFNFSELLSDSYKGIGNTSKEIDYLKLAYGQVQTENDLTLSKLQKYNSQLQSQILHRENARLENERKELNRKALFIASIIALVIISLITILYVLFIQARNKKNLLVKENEISRIEYEKEKEISRIEYEKTEIRSKLTESELTEKRFITNQLASHIKLKQQTESAFLQKIKELKRKKPQNIEVEISELQVKMMNLINMDQNFEHIQHVTELNQDFRWKLKKAHPELNQKELQFCTYLLSNLNSKEISAITNHSDGAIRAYKTRLKNKMLGQLEIKLVDYLQNL
jgi:hypothetical protein